jgi:hypothetical protein
MTSAEEVGRILAGAESSVRVLYFAALLARESGLGATGLIVVGGSAIEIYTRGSYASGDIDLVADRQKVLSVLKSWKFKPGGRVWHQNEWNLVVDIVREDYHGDPHRTRIVQTPYGEVRVEGLEDSMVRRLISSRYWEIPGDFGHALLLATQYRADIDWDYAAELAKYDNVSDLLIDLRRRIGLPKRRE